MWLHTITRWLTITNDNRTWRLGRKKQMENNATLIPRRSVEGNKSSTSAETSPADCQASAVRVGHDTLNLYSTIDGHSEQILDETHRMMPDQAQTLSPHQGTSRLLLRAFTPIFLTSHVIWTAQTLTPTKVLADYCWECLRQHFRQNSTTAPSTDENMWKHARNMLMNVSTRPSKRIDFDSF
jgi:hypothetical protein